MVKCPPRQPSTHLDHPKGKDRPSHEQQESFAPILPVKIIHRIYHYVENDSSASEQRILNNLSLVCRSWYAAFVCLLYNSIHCDKSRFQRFVETICCRVNAKRPKNGLAGHIHTLNLEELYENASKSLLAKLLGKTRHNLRVFCAPPVWMLP